MARDPAGADARRARWNDAVLFSVQQQHGNLDGGNAVAKIALEQVLQARHQFVEVGLRIADVARTTVSFHHMSHGKLMNRTSNPGTETVGVSFWWAVG